MSDVQFFRDGIEDGKVLIRICSSCGLGAFPPMPGCPHCGWETGEIVRSSGVATLYSWTVCYIAFAPSLADDVPYVVGLVDVPEGARLIARIECPVENLHAGMTLTAVFPRDDGGSRRLAFAAQDDAS